MPLFTLVYCINNFVFLLQIILGAALFKSVLSSGQPTEELLGTVVSLYTRDSRLHASIMMPDQTTFMRYVCVS